MPGKSAAPPTWDASGCRAQGGFGEVLRLFFNFPQISVMENTRILSACEAIPLVPLDIDSSNPAFFESRR